MRAFRSGVVACAGNVRHGTLSEELYVGTSGWTYDDWRGRFYPREVPKKSWLAWYAGQFSATEINGSFYRTPSRAAVEAWRESTPRRFRFAWKASQFHHALEAPA